MNILGILAIAFGILFWVLMVVGIAMAYLGTKKRSFRIYIRIFVASGLICLLFCILELVL